MARITFELHADNEGNRPIFLSGNFNNWQGKDERFRLNPTKYGSYSIDLDTHDLDFPLQYKYLRGDWDEEELNQWGNPPGPRQIDHPKSKVIDIVPKWRSHGLICDEKFMPNKFIIEEDFEIPQLNKRRKIWALFPHDYDQNNKRYPVLYLQDAQNLTNPDSPYGNWAIDQRMGIMAEQGFGDIIIIAIEHGGEDRIKEYSPFHSDDFGQGEGKRYAQFMVDTLKPYVDKKFRTLPDREHTGIGGSSMGGLISVYAGLTYSDVFGKWMIFSPSFWVSSKIYQRALDFSNQLPVWVYLYGGKKESANMESDLHLFISVLERKGIQNDLLHINLSILEEGLHQEKYWGEEFPHAIRWLFYNE